MHGIFFTIWLIEIAQMGNVLSRLSPGVKDVRSVDAGGRLGMLSYIGGAVT